MVGANVLPRSCSHSTEPSAPSSAGRSWACDTSHQRGQRYLRNPLGPPTRWCWRHVAAPLPAQLDAAAQLSKRRGEKSPGGAISSVRDWKRFSMFIALTLCKITGTERVVKTRWAGRAAESAFLTAATGAVDSSSDTGDPKGGGHRRAHRFNSLLECV